MFLFFKACLEGDFLERGESTRQIGRVCHHISNDSAVTQMSSQEVTININETGNIYLLTTCLSHLGVACYFTNSSSQ